MPKLYFDDVRPGEPRRLPSTGKEVELPGLLAALKAAKKNNSTQRVAAATQEQPDNRPTRNRVYDSTEYHWPRHGHIFDILRKIYDPEDHAHVTNQYYAPALLLQRESLRFDPQIQQLLRTIWNAADMDDSGAIDRLEYMELHNCINCALIGRAAGDSMMRIFLCHAKTIGMQVCRAEGVDRGVVRRERRSFFPFIPTDLVSLVPLPYRPKRARHIKQSPARGYFLHIG